MKIYFAGWDGGGTSTGIECLDIHGDSVLRTQVGPLNFNGNTPQEIEHSVQQALAAMAVLPGGLGSCQNLCIGSAGVSNQQVPLLLEKLLRKFGYMGNYTLVGDHETAFYGALSGKSGILLIAGTGSICYGKNQNGQTHRCGGWGHIVDDEGSGYAIGRSILTAVVRASDGRIPPTILTNMVFEQLSISSIQELIGYIYHKDTGKKSIASLAPLFSVARDLGDTAALSIQENAADELAKLALAATQCLHITSGNIAFAGSVLQKDRLLREAVASKILALLATMTIIEPEHNAAYGAALLALNICNKKYE